MNRVFLLHLKHKNKTALCLILVAFVLFIAIIFQSGRLYQKGIEKEVIEIEIAPSWHPSYEQYARHVARKHRIDEEFVLAIMWQESRFNPDCVSHKGAKGLMQLMPCTIRHLGMDFDHSWQANIDGGIRYLKWIQEQKISKMEHILMAYNWGIGNFRKYMAGKIEQMPKETQNYIVMVKRHMAKKPWRKSS